MAFTGFTAQTAKHLQLDAGAFLKDYDPTTDTWETAKATKLIGATQGGAFRRCPPCGASRSTG